MDVRFLEHADEIRQRFIRRFVLSWEAFQRRHQALISEKANTNYPIDLEWYQDAYLWDKMGSDFPEISFPDALTFLQERSGKVLFLCEKGKYAKYRGQIILDRIGEADSRELAAEIKNE